MGGLMHPLLLELRAEGGQFFREVGRAKTEVGRLAVESNRHMELMNKVGKAAFLGMATAAGGMAVESIRQFTEFQDGLTQLVTGAGESAENLKTVIGPGMKKIAVDTASSLGDINKALFMIESSGYHGAEALNVAKVAMQGAKVGAADASVTANALTTVMKNFAIPAGNATQAMNVLVAGVKNGKMHMEDLAQYFGTAAVTAKALGYSLEDTMGAFATMTVRGVDASEAATYLRNSMVNLKAPSQQAQGVLESIGLSAESLNQTINKQGLMPGLMKLSEAMRKHLKPGTVEWNEALRDLGGGKKSLLGLLLLNSNTKDLAAAINGVREASKKTKGDVEGMGEVTQDAGFKFKKAQQQINVALVNIGEKITPVVASMVDWASRNGDIVAGLGALAVALGTAAVAVWAVNVAMDANPAVLITAAILGLGAGLVILYKNFAPVREVILKFAEVGVKALKGFADVALIQFGLVIHGAALLFGWVPGVGPKLKEAAKAFDKFKADLDKTLDNTAKSLGAKAAEAGASMAKGLGAAQYRVGQVGSGLGDAALNGVKKALDQFKGVGQAMSQGIINGLGDMQKAVNRRAGQTAAEALYAMRHAVKMASPSKETHLIGLAMGEGLVNGLLASQSLVRGQGIALAKAALYTGGSGSVPVAATAVWRPPVPTMAGGVGDGGGNVTVHVAIDGERVASVVQRRNKQYALRNGRGLLVT